MTRETKIGLLVGLAFIIVIGILLSDHLTSSTQPPQAALSRVGEVSRAGTQVIGKPEVPVTVEPPAHVQPDRPIVTVEQLTKPKPLDIVQFGNAAVPQAFPPPGEPTVTKAVDASAPSIPPVDPNLAKLAQQHGEELTLTTPGQPTKLVPSTPENNPTSGMLKYTAQEGDSLSRMAGRFLGGNTKANRDLIVKANPSLVADPNKIVVGRSYLIPTAAAGAPAQQFGATDAKAPPAATVAVKAPASTPSADGQFVFYTVKENDSLWTIARDQLGTGNAWKDIKDWNKDVLKGGDTVHTNMRLRLKKSAGNTASASVTD
ncbi:MAG TPA: LysM peptidoglycan-binding domain-containing protein [Tepidisphaeraceae bacterium]|nr:LysM peptidoglycan-binding domain-containing protein [Tepidisphaeraceae bacterium]